MSRLVGYLRVSTAGQAADGFGLPSQRRAIANWAREHGHELVSWCQDAGVSGTVEGLERPGFSCVVDRIHAGEADGIVAFDLTRIARLLWVQEAALGVLWRMGAEVWTVTTGQLLADDEDDPTRTLLRQVLGAIAQFERANTAHKMRLGKARAVAAGRRGGGRTPFGWDAKNGALLVNEREQAALRMVRSWRSAGVTWRDVAERLNVAGVRAKSGGGWSFQLVQQTVAAADARSAVDTVAS